MAYANDGGIVPVNTRSPRQWEILSAAYDFQGKKVLDVGCGYGDLLLYARAAGATILGVEQNQEIVESLSVTGVPMVCMDLERYLAVVKDNYFDVAFCFSVLPYLKDVEGALREMGRIAKAAFIECQYIGDGPGIVDGDEEMSALLVKFWPEVQKIGFTVVQGRNTQRSIWMCEKGEME